MTSIPSADRPVGAAASASSPGEAAGGRAGAAAGGVPWIVGTALVAALLMLRLPYRGVRHDAILYLGQALARSDPGWAKSDLYFEYGSQDRFSVFSRLFAWPVSVLGIPTAEMLVLVAGMACSLAVIYRLARGIDPRRRWVAMLLVVGVTHFFGERGFSLLEPFVTARTAAEPLALLALLMSVRGQYLAAAAALLLGFLLHPLVALPAALVIWFFLIGLDRRWLGVAVLAIPVLALAWKGVPPFAGLLRVYDMDWLAMVANVNTPVYVSDWGVRDASTIVLNLASLWLATRGQASRPARLARAACCASVVMLAISFVAADWYHDVLVTQLQLWRTVWVSHLLAILWLPSLVLALWHRDGQSGRLAALALVAAYCAVDAWEPDGWALVLWAFATLGLLARGVPLGVAMVRFAQWATVAAALGVTLHLASELSSQIAMHRQGYAATHRASIPFQLPLLTVPGSVWMLRAWRRPSWRPALRAAAALSLLVAALQYDQRTSFTRFIESATDAQRPFQQRIPEQATVYWEESDLAPVWFLLRRAGFAGEGQFSGLLFNRETAIAAGPRLTLLGPVARALQECGLLESVSHGTRFRNCDLPEADFFRFCTAPRAHADFLVTHVDYPNHVPTARWVFDPRDGASPVTYYLHDCRTVR